MDNIKNKKCKCMLCGKTGELYDDFDGYNYIPVEIPILKQNYLICRDCFEYLKNKAEGRK